MLLGVEVHGTGSNHQREEEKDEAKEPHALPGPGALALVTLADLDELSDHVVEEKQSYIGRQDGQNWCG